MLVRYSTRMLRLDVVSRGSAAFATSADDSLVNGSECGCLRKFPALRYNVGHDIHRSRTAHKEKVWHVITYQYLWPF